MKALMRAAASRLRHDKQTFSAIGSDDPIRSALAFGEDRPRAAHSSEAKPLQ
jgi:hypothetical protein